MAELADLTNAERERYRQRIEPGLDSQSIFSATMREVRSEFLARVSLRMLKLACRKDPITAAEYRDLRANSYERRLLYCNLTDEALLYVTDLCLADVRPLALYELTQHSADGLIREVVPLLKKALEAKLQVDKGTKLPAVTPEITEQFSCISNKCDYFVSGKFIDQNGNEFWACEEHRNDITQDQKGVHKFFEGRCTYCKLTYEQAMSALQLHKCLDRLDGPRKPSLEPQAQPEAEPKPEPPIDPMGDPLWK